jgi:hypothetical protein
MEFIDIEDKKNEIVNTIKILIYKENPSLLDKLDFENDNIFLEPLLFAYFNSKFDSSLPNQMLEEILQGYFLNNDKIKNIYSFNKNNISYIPQVGYFSKENKDFFSEILMIHDFEIIREIHPVLEKYFSETKDGHVINSEPKFESAYMQSYYELSLAIQIIKTHLPVFYTQLVFANKKIFLHNNPKIYNFTTIKTLGMLYFYVIGGYNVIYFIEEIIHQGSHNYLNYAFYHKEKYFKIDAENIVMRDLTNQLWDYRSVFSAFHGLYTVTKRLEGFDILLSKNVFIGRDKHELLGRMLDQFLRVETGLEYLNSKEVFTELGFNLYLKLLKNSKKILAKYDKLKDIIDVSNIGVDFRYDDFCKLNPIENFYNLEKQGVFNF